MTATTATSLSSFTADDVNLTEKQVAAITTLSVATLQRMRANTTLGGPPFRKLGNGRTSRVVYSRSKLLAWLESRERRSTSDRTGGER